jgi:hypothetical protein
VKSLIALNEKINDNKVMKVFVFTILIFLNYFSYAADNSTDIYVKSLWKLSKTQKKYLNNGEIIADSNVTDSKGIQNFDLKAIALHKNTCSKVLRKLSLLEQYSTWIDFIKSSQYNEKARLFTLTADHTLLPYPMIIHIIVDRPTKEGKYPFRFPTGIFRGLTGHFDIKQVEKKCIFFAKSSWSGKKTRLPNFAIEIFSETLSKLGGAILMRKAN